MSSSFSISQRKVLAILPKISGFTSLSFDALIIWTILSGWSRTRREQKQQRNSTYHRLVLGISIVDFSSSLWMGLSTWPIPAGEAVYAVGTETTCRVQGFWIQTSIASTFYNASLSTYYVLLIRYGYKQEALKRWEPWFHILPIVWGLSTASVVLSLDLVDNANLWCWIGKNYDWARWALYYGPLWLMIAIVSINCILVWAHIRRVEKFSRRFAVEFNNKGTSTVSTDAEKNSKEMNSARMQPPQQHSKNNVEAVAEMDEMDSDCDHSLSERDEIHRDEDMDGSINEAIAENGNTECTRKERHLEERQVTFAVQPERQIGSRAKKPRLPLGSKLQRAKQAAQLCLLYAGAFYLNWIALTIIRVIQVFNPSYASFWLFLVASFTTPIQGLPNFLIYLGPLIWEETQKHYRKKQLIQQIQEEKEYAAERLREQSHTHRQHHGPLQNIGQVSSALYCGVREAMKKSISEDGFSPFTSGGFNTNEECEQLPGVEEEEEEEENSLPVIDVVELDVVELDAAEKKVATTCDSSGQDTPQPCEVLPLVFL